MSYYRQLGLTVCWQALYMEREGLSSTLDESADRIVMLEKEARERDCLVREHHSQTRSVQYSTVQYSTDQITSFDQRSDESDGWCWSGGWGDLTIIILCCRFGTSKKRVMN